VRDKFLEFCRLNQGIAEMLRLFSIEINKEIFCFPPQLPVLSEFGVTVSGNWPWRGGYNMSVFEIVCTMLLTKSSCRMVVLQTESCFSLLARLGRYCSVHKANPNSAAILARLSQMCGSKEYAIGIVSLSDPFLSQSPALRVPEGFIPLTIVCKVPKDPASQTALAKDAFQKILANFPTSFE
jgi:hypothetical protein